MGSKTLNAVEKNNANSWSFETFFATAGSVSKNGLEV